MKASELRIGNYVTDGYYDTFKTVIEVESIDEKGINLSIEDDGRWAEISERWIEPEYRFDLLFGIPLTEEWLENFGFENKPDIDNGTYHTTVFEKDGVALLFFMGDFDECSINGDLEFDFTYVHTLQNFWHLFRKQELKIK